MHEACYNSTDDVGVQTLDKSTRHGRRTVDLDARDNYTETTSRKNTKRKPQTEYLADREDESGDEESLESNTVKRRSYEYPEPPPPIPPPDAFATSGSVTPDPETISAPLNDTTSAPVLPTPSIVSPLRSALSTLTGQSLKLLPGKKLIYS